MCPEDKVAKIKKLYLRSDLCMLQMHTSGTCNNELHDFHTHTVKHLDTIKVFYLLTNAEVNFLTNNFKIYIKIDIKTAPTCFGASTIIRERII
jgi:hypothetical protein